MKQENDLNRLIAQMSQVHQFDSQEQERLGELLAYYKNALQSQEEPIHKQLREYLSPLLTQCEAKKAHHLDSFYYYSTIIDMLKYFKQKEFS